MSTYPFQNVVSSLDELRDIVSTPSELVIRKQLPKLDRHARRFIERSPFCIVSSAGASGRCDASPKGDRPGFVMVLDDHTLIIPDRPGNRRIDTFQNILENPHVGLIFMIPKIEETLRVNGRACIVRDEALLAQARVQGKQPALGLAVEAEEVYFHCAKAFRRSRLWQPDQWADTSDLPTLGQILVDQLHMTDTTASEMDCDLEESYAKRLY